MNIIEDIDKYADQITMDIECFGYGDGVDCKFAEGHVPYRRIRIQDQGKIIRCRACQIEYKRVYNRDLLRKKRASDKENREGGK